ncbi:MAG: hypothetical protein NT070_04075 [Cyanobacteria bacterium]|nr:hypothetical protein [Cyanobacteriota bacterium]
MMSFQGESKASRSSGITFISDDRSESKAIPHNEYTGSPPVPNSGEVRDSEAPELGVGGLR